MKNRGFSIILGSVLLILSFMGILLIEQHTEKEELIRQLELTKQKEEAKAKSAEENRKTQEEKKRVEQAKMETHLAEIRRIKAEEERIKAERQRVQEDEKRRQQNEREQALLRERERREKTVSTELILDLNDAKEVAVAYVHIGDEVSVKIDRANGTNTKLFAGIAGEREIQSKRERERQQHRSHSRSYYLDERIIVHWLINDKDKITITDQLSKVNSGFRYTYDSKNGAVLYIGTGISEFQPGNNGSRSQLRVAMDIYSNNRWNIMPRMVR